MLVISTDPIFVYETQRAFNENQLILYKTKAKIGLFERIKNLTVITKTQIHEGVKFTEIEKSRNTFINAACKMIVQSRDYSTCYLHGVENERILKCAHMIFNAVIVVSNINEVFSRYGLYLPGFIKFNDIEADFIIKVLLLKKQNKLNAIEINNRNIHQLRNPLVEIATGIRYNFATYGIEIID